MKIVCGSCQAKYSIADEKVQGKVFKIRCKRCSEVIVVRGDEGGQEAPAAAPSYDAAADAIWHVVINGEQAGPYAPSQLAEMLTAGHVDWEAYVWAEGFDNWAAMRDVPDLVAAITGQGQEQQHAEPAYAAQPSMGADPFADDGGGGGGGLFAEPAAPASRNNLFGGGEREQEHSPFDGGGGGRGGGVVASAPSPRVSVEQAMTGARNENSVLFSLKNLQALATGSSGAPAAAASTQQMGPGNRPGFAGGDGGSGLIDIRALATATGMGDSSRDADEKDALLSLGSAQTGAFGALGSPMLAPVGSDDGDSKKGLMIAVFGGFALLAGAAIVVAIIMKPQVAPQAPMMEAAAPPAAAIAAAANPQPAAPAAPVEPPSEGEKAAAAAAAAANAEKPGAGASTGASHSAKHHESGDKGAGSAPSEAAPSHSEASSSAKEDRPAPKAKGGSSSIDELLDGAIGGGSSSGRAAKKEAAAPAPSNLPEKPSRDDVIAAMNGVKDDVKACGKGATGVAFANITVVGKTGRISSAEITGITGEPGSCIARAVRKATFPKFQSDSFQVKFPFKL